jgi:alginate O-acetyltransferase complex protein AlgI
MLFNSSLFIFGFLPLTLGILYLLVWCGQKQWAIRWLALASIVFYAMWNIDYVPILLGSILVNYALGAAILSSRRHKNLWLLAGLIFNLGALAYFKYTVFILREIAPFFLSGASVPAITLPLGISFFTFTQIAYLVDCKREKAKHYCFSDYVAFVTFFPHLVAGPILQHKSFMPQLERARFSNPRLIKLYWGVVFFAVGLFKKVIIADTLAPYVSALFAPQASLTILQAWNAGLLYTFQLYYDFSGYSEMALGLGFMMNIRIPLNFNSPYKARSVSEFWYRWHMSLSRFLREYLYIPLGGNRVGKIRHLINLFVTMLLGGFWHGAGWTFLFWGGLHGTYLVINHLWRRTKIIIPSVLCHALTFLVVVIAWVFFRAPDLTSGLHIVSAMAGLHTLSPTRDLLISQLMLLFAAIAFVLWSQFMPNTRQIVVRRNPAWHVTALAILTLVVSLAFIGKPTEFLYFQF